VLTNKELFVPGNGALSVAPVGSTPPTDASTALDATFKDLGYITEDGATLTPSMETDNVMGWQSFYPLRRLVTTRDLQVKAALLQINEVTLSVFMGGAQVSGGAGAFTVAPPPPSLIDNRSWVLDGIDGVRKYRLFIPVGVVVSLGDWVWTRTGAASMEITIGLAAETPGNEWKLFVADAEFAAT